MKKQWAKPFTTLFFVHNGVNSEDWSADGFT
jgi:hypothetical protein